MQALLDFGLDWKRAWLGRQRKMQTRKSRALIARTVDCVAPGLVFSRLHFTSLCQPFRPIQPDPPPPLALQEFWNCVRCFRQLQGAGRVFSSEQLWKDWIGFDFRDLSRWVVSLRLQYRLRTTPRALKEPRSTPTEQNHLKPGLPLCNEGTLGYYGKRPRAENYQTTSDTQSASQHHTIKPRKIKIQAHMAWPLHRAAGR